MIFWICNPQNGGCGYVGPSSESDPLKRASIDANMDLKLKVMELVSNCTSTIDCLRQKKKKPWRYKSNKQFK